jgi:hypothetical protein
MNSLKSNGFVILMVVLYTMPPLAHGQFFLIFQPIHKQKMSTETAEPGPTETILMKGLVNDRLTRSRCQFRSEPRDEATRHVSKAAEGLDQHTKDARRVYRGWLCGT